MWLGSGFTKTQYAEHFVQVHENICRGLDLADYDFAVVFDVIARMSGLRPSVKTRR